MKDIIIIGGGPAGYVAGIKATQLGADVLIIENRRLGGTCLNRGCIPTKALFKNAELIKDLEKSADFGLNIPSFSIDFDRIMARKDEVVDQLVTGIEQLIKVHNIEVVEGCGQLSGPHSVKVSSTDGEEVTYEGKHIIIATGSEVWVPEMEGSHLPKVITSDDLLTLKELPKSMAIAGGGVIGMEFANIFNAFGTEVTVVSNAVLHRTDGEIQKRLANYVKKQGINLSLKAHATRIEEGENGLRLIAEGKKGEYAIEAEYVLLAIGRKPNVEHIGLEALDIAFDQKGIKVNEHFQTNIPHIYAVGDVIGGKMLAHVASHEAIDAVLHIMGEKTHSNYDVVPDCIFVHPEVAYVGLTEEELKEREIPYLKSKFNFMANGKALAMGYTEGFVKVLAHEETHKILGVHILGPHASDLIHESALALQHELDIHDITHTIHAHPTLAESYAEAVGGLLEEAIHIAPSKKKKK